MLKGKIRYLGTGCHKDDMIFKFKDVEETVESLRMKLCDGDHIDENEQKVHCRDAYKKQSYKSRRCNNCRMLDELFSDLLTLPDGKAT